MKRMAKDWGVALALGAVVYLAVGLLRPMPDLPSDAPLFSVRSLDGDILDLAEFRGRTVVLNFWATWCGPCKSEAPDFTRFATANTDIVVIGLAVNSGPESKVRRVAKSWGITYPIAIADMELQRSYDISTLPTTVVVGPEGGVKDVTVGAMSEWRLARAVR